MDRGLGQRVEPPAEATGFGLAAWAAAHPDLAQVSIVAARGCGLLRDGELDSGVRQRWEVAHWIRKLQPTVVLGHDPWKRYRLHPDHRAAGQLLCDAIVGARDPHFHRDLGLAPFRPTALLLFEADLPNHAENVTATVERKLDALLAHESQFESTMHAKGGDPALLDAFRARILDRLAELGRPWDLPYAEVFALMVDL